MPTSHCPCPAGPYPAFLSPTASWLRLHPVRTLHPPVLVLVADVLIAAPIFVSHSPCFQAPPPLQSASQPSQPPNHSPPSMDGLKGRHRVGLTLHDSRASLGDSWRLLAAPGGSWRRPREAGVTSWTQCAAAVAVLSKRSHTSAHAPQDRLQAKGYRLQVGFRRLPVPAQARQPTDRRRSPCRRTILLATSVRASVNALTDRCVTLARQPLAFAFFMIHSASPVPFRTPGRSNTPPWAFFASALVTCDIRFLRKMESPCLTWPIERTKQHGVALLSLFSTFVRGSSCLSLSLCQAVTHLIRQATRQPTVASRRLSCIQDCPDTGCIWPRVYPTFFFIFPALNLHARYARRRLACDLCWVNWVSPGLQG